MQDLAGMKNVEVRVLVCDNDRSRSARETVDAWAERSPFVVSQCHEARSGVSHVRNTLIEQAQADVLAFLDDDEFVEPGWLRAHLETLAATGAQVSVGPVDVVFPSDFPNWMKPALRRAPRADRTPIEGRALLGGNFCLRRECLSALPKPPFSPAFGKSGGEDTLFGVMLEMSGARLVWSAHARAHEPLTEERARLRWLLKRRLRSGATFSRVERARHGKVPWLTCALRAGGSCWAAVTGRHPAEASLIHRFGLLAYGAGVALGTLDLSWTMYGESEDS